MTEGKYYKVTPSEKSPEQYWVWEDDLNQGGWYWREHFQTIEDNRDDKLEEIVK